MTVRQKRSKGAVDLLEKLDLSETMEAMGTEYLMRDIDFEP